MAREIVRNKKLTKTQLMYLNDSKNNSKNKDTMRSPIVFMCEELKLLKYYYDPKH